MFNPIAADILDRFEPGAIGWAVLGLIGALSVAALVLTVLNQARKYFGRQPSLSEILKSLVTIEDHDEYKEEVRLRCLGLEKQISDARHSFDERANKDLVRIEKVFEDILDRGELRDKTMAALSDSVSMLQERTKTHIRNFDSLFTKCDNLIREISRSRSHRDE